MLTRVDIEQGLLVAIKKVSGADAAVVAPERSLADKSLRDDLDVDSLAMVELSEEIADLYGVAIPEESHDDLATFGDTVEYIQSVLKAA